MEMSEMKNETKTLTDYELGNSVLFRLGDNAFEICQECRDSHPSISEILGKMGEAFIKYGQGMEESDPSDSRCIKGRLSPAELEEILKADILAVTN